MSEANPASWLAKLRALSLEHLYMTDALPAGVPPHLVWQAPLAIARRDDSWDALCARVRRAGELWLVNHDLRPHAELVIAHVERPWFMAFQRAARPDEGHLFIGPFERRVLRDGQPLWDLPRAKRFATC